jgi:hypothetical protein
MIAWLLTVADGAVHLLGLYRTRLGAWICDMYEDRVTADLQNLL